MEKKEIIDFETKGNLVRFYLGKNGKQWGDDWGDKPYEHNAGRVYDEFVQDKVIVVIPFDEYLYEPHDGHLNSPYSKEDMIKRRLPCLVVTKEYFSSFEQALAYDKSQKYYFGDYFTQTY